ncbi:MAG TPA: 4-hydroxy-tetrahydrodipicolinate reductase [Nitrospiria bacterium]
MINAIVMGAAGKMGGRIISLMQDKDCGLKLAAAVEAKDSPALGRDAGEAAGCGRLGVPISPSAAHALARGAVVIDFTEPSATMELLSAAAQAGAAVVIGTTGFSKTQTETIRTLAGKIPCVLSPNMSVGVNLVFRLLAEAARVTGDDYDVEIVEVHHRFKKDAPSGTALKMAEVLAEALKRDLDRDGVYARKGLIGPRKTKEIGIQSVRAGDVVGDHTVIFGALGERIEITHRAHSRDNFARGALVAAQWLASRPPGLYDMMDVLGLRGK